MLNNAALKKIKKTLAPDQAHDLSLLFTALGDINRLNMVRLIKEYPEICVTDMARLLKISAPAVSQHFRILELSGLVNRIRSGRMICYELNKKNKLVVALLKIIASKK